MRDVSAVYPDSIAEMISLTGNPPTEMLFEPGFICAYEDHYWIHARATLPLLAIENGVGFGLWVEVTKADIKRYQAATENDNLYQSFITQGKLANQWPGFENIKGAQVTVRTVHLNEKVYITEVSADYRDDPLFEVALNTQVNDEAGISRIRDLVMAYMQDFHPDSPTATTTKSES